MPLFLAAGDQAASGVQLTGTWLHLSLPAGAGAVKLRAESNNAHVASLENIGEAGERPIACRCTSSLGSLMHVDGAGGTIATAEVRPPLPAIAAAAAAARPPACNEFFSLLPGPFWDSNPCGGAGRGGGRRRAVPSDGLFGALRGAWQRRHGLCPVRLLLPHPSPPTRCPSCLPCRWSLWEPTPASL